MDFGKLSFGLRRLADVEGFAVSLLEGRGDRMQYQTGALGRIIYSEGEYWPNPT